MCLVLFSYTCKVGETSSTTVGSTTGVSSPTTVPPMHSAAQCVYPSQLQQQPKMATPSQLQQPTGIYTLYSQLKILLPTAEEYRLY